MRSDEEFYAYVWEKYQQRHPEGRPTRVSPPSEGYRYQQPVQPPRRPRLSRYAAAGMVLMLAAAVLCGAVFSGRLPVAVGPGTKESVPGISSAASAQGTSSVDTSSWEEYPGVGVWYRRVAYLPHGGSRSVVVSDAAALQAHLRQVDDEGEKKGWPATSWTVQGFVDALSSYLPGLAKADEIFDQEFFREQDLLIVEYSSSWMLPSSGFYTVACQGEEGLLKLKSFGGFYNEDETGSWQVFVSFKKGEAPQAKRFTVQAGAMNDWSVVRRQRVYGLWPEDRPKEPISLFSSEELDRLLTQWETDWEGFMDAEHRNLLNGWRTRYSADYFQTHDLVMYLLDEPSGSIAHQVYVGSPPTRLQIDRYAPFYANCDIGSYVFFMEVPKGTLTPDIPVKVEFQTVEGPENPEHPNYWYYW